MSRNAELLAMLTSHGIDPLKPFGGIPSMTQMDVAAMMAKCSPCESALLRAKYCGESDAPAWAYWFTHLMEQGWSDGDGRVVELSRITLEEHVSSPRCKACGGTKGQMIKSQWQVCPKCDGTGHSYLSDRAIGTRLGLKRLQSPWAGRLNWCRQELERWEYRALSKMG